jgi:hypothetical protein
LNTAADVNRWLTADNGSPCTVIGGALTIQQFNIKSQDLAKMLPLVAVCGSVTIQQLKTGTLQGLDNLKYIGGAFFLAQNARPWAFNGGVDDISALSSLGYVKGSMTVAQNFYLTKSDIQAGLSNVKVAGSVSIDFYNKPPSVPGAMASRTGQMKKCKV